MPWREEVQSVVGHPSSVIPLLLHPVRSGRLRVMNEDQPKPQRRRRRRTGRQDRPGPPADRGRPPDADAEERPRPRQDNRRSSADARRPSGAQPRADSGRTHRAPDSAPRPRRADGNASDGRRRASRDGGGGRERPPRVFEPPAPQDPRSIELGAAFKEAQTALRDAARTLEKRRAEFGDEPEWLREQYRVAEQRFEEAATAWAEHLETTGRTMARRA